MDPGIKICFLCVKLQDPTVNTAEQNEIRASYTQCSECGVCGTTVTDPCRTCRRADIYEASASDYEWEQTAQRRHANLEVKLLKGRVDNPGNVGTMIPIEDLQTIRATQGFSNVSHRSQVNHCTVYYECRHSDCSKHVDQMLGTGVIFFPDTNTMLALRSHIVKEVNGQWTEFYSAPLLEEETSLCAPNNYVFPADDLIITVAHWYQVYSHPEYRETYIVLPKHTQRKGKSNSKVYAFSIELYINVGQYAVCTKDPKLIGTGRAGTKRKTSAIRVADDHVTCQSPKRIRDLVPAQSSGQTLWLRFISDRDLLTQPLPTVSVVEIRFKKTICLISEGSGSPTLLEESSLLSGFLETRPLDLSASEPGSTKDVYGLQIGSKSYVAKKLVNAGGGRSEDIPLSKAISVLTADFVRLKRMAYFADQFKALACDQGVDIAEFDVSEAFLIKTYQPKSAPPTEHSGDENDADDQAQTEPTEDMTRVYLVEPMRLTTTVVKFSGTLGSTTCSDLRSLTVTAYAHYVAVETACRYIFADIQGSNNGNTDGKLSLTLFDPMTHTVEGMSGVGDHGAKGLQDFVSSHTCNHICSTLQLASSEVLQDTLDELLSGESAEQLGEALEAASDEY